MLNLVYFALKISLSPVIAASAEHSPQHVRRDCQLPITMDIDM